MKILITGASGFFGRSLINALQLESGDFEVFCPFRSNTFDMEDSRFQWVPCDLLNSEDIKTLISDLKPTHLVHLAWYVHPQKFWNAKENFDWLDASIQLFQAFCEHKGQVFIGAGTLAEYDWTNGVLDEFNTALAPNTIYGQCKKSLHELLLSFRNTYSPDTKIIWPRIGYFFGDYEPKEKLISKIIDHIKRDLPLNLASPDLKRPYAHVKYFGQCITQLLMFDKKQDLTFNMSVSTLHTLNEMVECVRSQLCGTSSKIYYDTYKAEPIILSVKDNILREQVGFTIPDTFFEDLEKLVGAKNGKF